MATDSSPVAETTYSGGGRTDEGVAAVARTRRIGTVDGLAGEEVHWAASTDSTEVDDQWVRLGPDQRVRVGRQTRAKIGKEETKPP